MTPEQATAYIHAQATAAAIEMEAMKVENLARVQNGHSPYYGEAEFRALIDNYGLHHNSVLTIFQQCVPYQ